MISESERRQAYISLAGRARDRKNNELPELQTGTANAFYTQNIQIIQGTKIRELDKFDRSFSAYLAIYTEVVLNRIFGANFADFTKIESQIPLKWSYQSFCIPIQAKEYINSLIRSLPADKYNKIVCNTNYEELLGVIVEMIAAHEFEKEVEKTGVANNVSNIELRRLQKRSREARQMDSFIQNGGLEGTNLGYIDLMQTVRQYRTERSQTSYINNLYGSRVEEIYQTNPQAVFRELQAVVNGKQTIPETIENFGMSFENPETNKALLKKIEIFSKK